MKQLLLLLFILSFFPVQSQQLIFRNETVTQVTLESITGFYHPERKANIGKRDVLEINYDTTGRQYVAGSFKKGTYYTPSDKNEEPFKNEMEMPGYEPRQVEGNLLMKLFDALNQDMPLDSMLMDAETFRSLVNDTAILLVANNLKLTAKLNESATGKEKLISAISGDQEKFNSFLKSHIDTACFYNMNADYWDRILITISTPGRSYRFEGNTKDHFRQAWFEFSTGDAGEKVSRCVLNPVINETLLQLLPMKFISRYYLDKRAMTESYLEWYLREHLR